MKILERIPGRTAVQLRDRALLEVLSSTGLRRQELVSARPSLVGRSDDPGWLFVSKSGAKLGGNTVREVVLRWTKAAGIAKAVSPHTLRRSCATGMIRNRANPAHVKELRGHDDFGSLQAYVRLEIADLKEAHRKFHPREREEGDDEAAGAGVPE